MGPPVALSTSRVDASNPQVVIDQEGTITAAWIENGVIITRSKSIRDSWSRSVSLSGSGATSPSLGIDAKGNITALWNEKGMILTCACQKGKSWGDISYLSLAQASAPQLAVSSCGNAAVAWEREGYIEAATLPVGGKWTSAQPISDTMANNPAVAVNDAGQVVAVWHSALNAQDAIVGRMGSLSSWQDMLTVYSDSLSHNYPRVVIDSDGDATAAWFQYDTDGTVYTDVQVLTSNFSSTSWDIPPLHLSNAGLRNPANLSLRLVSDPFGNMIAAWSNSYDGATFAVETAMKSSGGKWSETVTLTLMDLYAFTADAATCASGDTLVTFMSLNGSSLSIYATTSELAGIVPNYWETSALLSQGEENGYPRCAFASFNSTLQAAAVWIGFDGNSQNIQVLYGSGADLLPPASLSVVSKTKSYDIFTDHYNVLSWTASPSSNINSYLIYRNGIFCMQTDAKTLQIEDHNRDANESITYGVAAMGNDYTVSPITSNP